MKNRILVFLVFITSILNAQSVNPETFPTVVGAISNKNVYTNTGGEGKISVQSIIDSAKLISGDFIPLTGTTVGNPISGDIELSQPNESLFLHFKNTDGVGNYLKIKTSDDGGIYSQYKYEDYENIVSANSIQLDNFANNTTIRLDNSSIMLANGNQITIDPASVKGIECNADFSANITDLDYTQKIYVDTHIAFIPIPTSSTDPGIKGQMAIDATYLYICVDTDTWTRVALTW
mgnify:CR=1 FL=1